MLNVQPPPSAQFDSRCTSPTAPKSCVIWMAALSLMRRDQLVADDVDAGPLQDLDRVVVRRAAALVRIDVEVRQVVDVRALEGASFGPAFSPSTPPWMFMRRPVKLSPHMPSTVADGAATAISTSSIRMLVPELMRMTPAFDVVARPRTIERVHVHVAGGDDQEAVDVLRVDRAFRPATPSRRR